ncbi:tyrosine-protein phosphatase [Nocardioides sp. BGMRC 2183]|nr:tyrosine-protein phosphatase [Nocardioides sp. BGMRC 2183]
MNLDVTTGAEQERWVLLTEIDNVRDLGGVPVAEGGRTRFGVAFRASTLQQGTAEDVIELVERRRVRTILDLRLPDEAEREGHGRFTAAGLEVIGLPVRKDEDTSLDVVVPKNTDLGRTYQQLLAGSGRSFATAAEVIADATRHGVLFHCAAGKDRTGVLAAVLYDALGVAPDDIVEDYALTAEREHQIRRRLIGIPAYQNLPPVANGAMSVDTVAIRGVIETLHEGYGGGAGYLLQHGLSEATLQRLRTVFVEPARPDDAAAPAELTR